MTATAESTTEAHFNATAKYYDFWKKKNQYYYDNLISLYKSLIRSGMTVMEIGCGTGTIIASLDPREGQGIDISEEMVLIAKRKYGGRSNLRFDRENILERADPIRKDYVILADVLEHVEDLPAFIRHLALRVTPGATMIVSIANPRWEPVLLLAEKLKLKMPEGPHNRISISATESLFEKAGFAIRESGRRLLCPKKLPGADWINRRFYKNRLLARCGFTVFWVLQRVERDSPADAGGLKLRGSRKRGGSGVFPA